MDVARAERIEASAMEDAFAAAPGPLAEALGLATARIAGATCLSATALGPSRETNHVHLVACDATPVPPERLDAIAQWYAQRDGHYVVGIVPAAEPALRQQLTERGFTESRSWSKFVHDPALEEPAPPTDLRLDDAQPEEFATVVARGFGMPEAAGRWFAAVVGRDGWRCLVARDDAAGGAAVACGAVFQDGGGSAWLGMAATLPAARGRGAQRALLAARVALARDAGCDLLVTETGVAVPGAPQQSHRNILRAGFGVAYERAHLASPGFPA